MKDFAGLFSGLFLQNFFEKILFIEKMVLFYERSANVSANEKSNVRESSGEPQQFSMFHFLNFVPYTSKKSFFHRRQ